MRSGPGLWGVPVLVVAVVSGHGCLQFAAFNCEQDPDCNSVTGGVCTADGQCAYPDDDCGGGLRYDQHADGDLAGTCVDLGATTGMTTTDPSSSPTSLETTLSSATTSDPETSTTPTSATTGSDSGTDTGDACGAAGDACCAAGACDPGLTCLGVSCGCVAQIEAGERHTCAVLNSGAVLCWGANDRGQLGDSINAFEVSPVLAVAPVPADPIRQVRAVDHTCVNSQLGNVQCFGANDSGQVAPFVPQPNSPIALASWVPFVSRFGVGVSHSCAADGVSVVCWGANGQSQLTGVEPGPGPISLGTGPVTALEIGGNFGCLIQSATLSCWGSNNQGQLATDPAVTPTIPTPTLMPVTEVAAVALGRTHTCSLSSGGVIQCWGRGDLGQLGDGTGTQQLSPVTVTLPIEAGVPIAIEAGDQHTCAVDDAGALWCWGSNANGQLMLEPDGMGFDGYTLVPVRIQLDAAVLAVTGGVTHTCVLTEEAQVLCWGTNSSGQIGNGTTNYAFEPQVVELACG